MARTHPAAAPVPLRQPLLFFQMLHKLPNGHTARYELCFGQWLSDVHENDEGESIEERLMGLPHHSI